MAPLEQDDMEFGKKVGNSYFKQSSLKVGESVELEIVDIEKNKATKYPMKGTDFNYRCRLGDGRVWDIGSAGVAAQIIRFANADKEGKFSPFKIKLSKVPTTKQGQSSYHPEKIG